MICSMHPSEKIRKYKEQIENSAEYWWNFCFVNSGKIGFPMHTEIRKHRFFLEITNYFSNVFLRRSEGRKNKRMEMNPGILRIWEISEFWKNRVLHASGNCANESSQWKPNPNQNSVIRFGFSASNNADLNVFGKE